MNGMIMEGKEQYGGRGKEVVSGKKSLYLCALCLDQMHPNGIDS